MELNLYITVEENRIIRNYLIHITNAYVRYKQGLYKLKEMIA